MQRRVLPCLVALILLGGVSISRADVSIDFTGAYNTTPISFTVGSSSYDLGGGGLIAATLTGTYNNTVYNNTQLTYMYCLQYNVDVYVGQSYGSTVVTSDGTTHGVPLGHNTALTNSGGSVKADISSSAQAAQDIAWLVATEAPNATTGTEQAGLQALIWAIITPGFQLTSTGDIATNYDTYLGQLLANNGLPNYTSEALWITPADSGGQYQAQVAYIQGETILSSVPEPGTMGMGAVGILFMSYCLRRRRLL